MARMVSSNGGPDPQPIRANLSSVPGEAVARAATPGGPRVVSAVQNSTRPKRARSTLQAWKLALRAKSGLKLASVGLSLALAAALALSGCLKGPNYRRPQVNVPQVYRGPDNAPRADGLESLGNAAWWTVFQDAALQSLIRMALA